MTFISVMATANRGALAGLAVGVVATLFLFARQIGGRNMVLVVIALVGMFAGAQLILDKYTLAASATDRVMATQFEGIVPDTRTMTWKPALGRVWTTSLPDMARSTTRERDWRFSSGHTMDTFLSIHTGVVRIGARFCGSWCECTRVPDCALPNGVRGTKSQEIMTLFLVWFSCSLV